MLLLHCHCCHQAVYSIPLQPHFHPTLVSARNKTHGSIYNRVGNIFEFDQYIPVLACVLPVGSFGAWKLPGLREIFARLQYF